MNLALLAMFTVTTFRSWFLGRLGFPPGSVVYPPQNTLGGRPDFVVVEGKNVLGWIEVELGGPNVAQMADYLERFDGHICCVSGAGAGDLLLSEIAEQLALLEPQLDQQQTLSAHMLRDLISQLGGKSNNVDYASPAEDFQTEPLLIAIAQRLGDRLIFGKPPPPPGQLVVSTITQKGWTLRVYSKIAAGRSASVLFNQSVGGTSVLIPSSLHLQRYLPNGGAVEEYVAFVRTALQVDLTMLAKDRRASMPESRLVEQADALATHLGALALAG